MLLLQCRAALHVASLAVFMEEFSNTPPLTDFLVFYHSKRHLQSAAVLIELKCDLQRHNQAGPAWSFPSSLHLDCLQLDCLQAHLPMSVEIHVVSLHCLLSNPFHFSPLPDSTPLPQGNSLHLSAMPKWRAWYGVRRTSPSGTSATASSLRMPVPCLALPKSSHNVSLLPHAAETV